ncbi:alanine racemase [Acerihabitans sp. KWT182]|uniref:Alanine racemase n=1 Tax=Acerihabitans sp. KWT182 TaxID=3157919 RepID=A0AAU7QF48_9GAMM
MDQGFRRPFRHDRLTPYIEIDGPRLARNLLRMQQKAAGAGMQLRPHVKTHKSVAIARRQIALGAVGITVSKPSEGVAFIRGGIRDLLLAYPVVAAESLQELLPEAHGHRARVAFIAADPAGIDAIARAARPYHSERLPVYIKVDVGLGRVGIPPTDGPLALALARHIQRQGLYFAGLLSHAGQAYAAQNVGQIADIAAREAQQLQALRRLLRQTGFADCRLSVGATPTALGAPLADGIDEQRPGNYALLDLTALRLGLCRSDDIAMTVVARVVAVNDRYAIIDAGSKALSSDRGPHGTGAAGWGIATDADNQRQYPVEKLSEEHGFISHNGTPPALGGLMRIFPNHACAVMAMFNHYVLRDEAYNGEVFPIEARGAFL